MSKSVIRIDRKSLPRDVETLRQFRLCGLLVDVGDRSSPVYVRCVSTEADAHVVAHALISKGLNSLFHPLPFTPSPWERASPYIKATYATLVMAKPEQEALAVTLRIGQERIDAAHRSGQEPLQHYRREIARRLESALSRPVNFWLTIEDGVRHVQQGGNDHLHGAVAISLNEKERVKQALREFGRYQRPSNAVRLKPIFSAWGWAGYASKDARLGAANATAITMTQSLIAPARQLYEDHLSIYNALIAMRNSGVVDEAA